MKYIYTKLESNDLTRPFVVTMAKIDKLYEAEKICNGIDDDVVREQINGKQVRLIYALESGYRRHFGIEAKYTCKDLEDAGCLIEHYCQEIITSIEEALVEAIANKKSLDYYFGDE